MLVVALPQPFPDTKKRGGGGVGAEKISPKSLQHLEFFQDIPTKSNKEYGYQVAPTTKYGWQHASGSDLDCMLLAEWAPGPQALEMVGISSWVPQCFLLHLATLETQPHTSQAFLLFESAKSAQICIESTSAMAGQLWSLSRHFKGGSQLFITQPCPHSQYQLERVYLGLVLQ